MISVFLLSLLLSAILIPAGLWVRRRVEERPLIDESEEVVVTGLFDE